MNINLYCNSGVSTGTLAVKIRSVAAESDQVRSFSFTGIDETLHDADVVLIGPQMRFKLKEVTRKCTPLHIPCAVIDMAAYGRMDGKLVYEQAVSLYREARGTL